MNNLFISYDLISPGQNYSAVTEAIERIGNWAKVHYSLYYVSSPLTAEQALNAVRAAADANDKIIVIKASDAHWWNLQEAVAKYIQKHWNN